MSLGVTIVEVKMNSMCFVPTIVNQYLPRQNITILSPEWQKIRFKKRTQKNRISYIVERVRICLNKSEILKIKRFVQVLVVGGYWGYTTHNSYICEPEISVVLTSA